VVAPELYQMLESLAGVLLSASVKQRG